MLPVHFSSSSPSTSLGVSCQMSCQHLTACFKLNLFRLRIKSWRSVDEDEVKDLLHRRILNGFPQFYYVQWGLHRGSHLQMLLLHPVSLSSQPATFALPIPYSPPSKHFPNKRGRNLTALLAFFFHWKKQYAGRQLESFVYSRQALDTE